MQERSFLDARFGRQNRVSADLSGKKTAQDFHIPVPSGTLDEINPQHLVEDRRAIETFLGSYLFHHRFSRILLNPAMSCYLFGRG